MIDEDNFFIGEFDVMWSLLLLPFIGLSTPALSHPPYFQKTMNAPVSRYVSSSESSTCLSNPSSCPEHVVPSVTELLMTQQAALKVAQNNDSQSAASREHILMAQQQSAQSVAQIQGMINASTAYPSTSVSQQSAEPAASSSASKLASVKSVANQPAELNYAAINGEYALYVKPVAGRSQVFVVDQSKNTTTQLTHLGNNTAPSFSAEGSKVFYKTDRDGKEESYFVPVSGGVEYPVESKPELFFVGDSLTVGSYPRSLSQFLHGRPFTQSGVAGQTSTQIAARVGAMPITMQCDNNQIPAQGEVKVSNLSSMLLSTIAESYTRTVPGTLAGVHGALTRSVETSADGSAEEVYTFLRDGEGSPVPCPTAATFLADAQGYDVATNVIWVGRNNYREPQAVLADVRSIVEWLKPSNPHYVVLSVLKGDFPAEHLAQPEAQQIESINAALKEAYPDHYVDVGAALVEAYNPALTQDVIDHANDVTPASLRTDPVHLNEAGNRVVAETVRAFLDKKGW